MFLLVTQVGLLCLFTFGHRGVFGPRLETLAPSANFTDVFFNGAQTKALIFITFSLIIMNILE